MWLAVNPVYSGGRLVVVVISGAFGAVVVAGVRSLVGALGAGLFWRVSVFGGCRAFNLAMDDFSFLRLFSPWWPEKMPL